MKKNYLFGFTILFLSLFFNVGLNAQDKNSSDEVIQVVEEMPRFPGCESADLSSSEKAKCSKEKLIEYLSAQIKYPEEAKKNKVEGTCVVEFVVTKSGEIAHAKLLKDIGSGCGDVALGVVNDMNKMEGSWTPGMHKNIKKNVRIVLPVSFKLPSSAGE